MTLTSPVTEGGHAYKLYAGRLDRLGIVTFKDLLYHIPFRYDDYSLVSPIGSIQAGETVTVRGEVTEMKNSYLGRFKTLQKAKITDGTGSIDVTWFNQPFLAKNITIGDMLSLSGKAGQFGKHLQLQSPEYEVVSPENPGMSLHTGRLVPVYPETRGLSSKWLRRQVHNALQNFSQEIEEFMPDEVLQKHGFPTLSEALNAIHFPKNFKDAEKARKRLAFDELFLLQLKGFSRRKEWRELITGNAFAIDGHARKISALKASLPFILTRAQEKAVSDISEDLTATKPMNRLLQGDVGSGKTVVAAIAMFTAYLNGYQSVLMAPTEILAQQHFATISKLLSPFGVKVDLVTGTKKLRIKKQESRSKKKHDSKFMIHDSYDVLIGTHAVLSEKIQFKKLGLIVIDEQQRFGVEQRGTIRQKGKNPHLLTMTATPIPRTVALTLYGDLDLSYLNEMPKGRQIIKTWLVPPEKRDGAYGWIKKEIQENASQIFIICPFIEESESMTTVKAATKEFERLQKEVFPDLQLGMLHGRQKTKEKDAVLTDFRNRKFDILVATPVVEVGIDIPNATVILIEAAERFGLAQLHQLRGRVGRGDKQSYCLLFTESKSELTLKRLKAMESSHVGAELAELDLRLRGAGELYGTKQSGTHDLKIADFSDALLIEQARNDAGEIFSRIDMYPKITEIMTKASEKNISPD
jgi:ATP-dependent DNA helicase RecG